MSFNEPFFLVQIFVKETPAVCPGRERGRERGWESGHGHGAPDIHTVTGSVVRRKLSRPKNTTSILREMKMLRACAESLAGTCGEAGVRRVAFGFAVIHVTVCSFASNGSGFYLLSYIILLPPIMLAEFWRYVFNNEVVTHTYICSRPLPISFSM